MLQQVDPNAHVIDLPFGFGINSIFNIKDLIAYKKSHSIPNYLFEMPPNLTLYNPIETSTPFTLTSTQKDNINVIIDEQVVLSGMVKFNHF